MRTKSKKARQLIARKRKNAYFLRMQKNNEKEMNKFIDKVFLPKITNAGRWPYRLRGGADSIGIYENENEHHIYRNIFILL